MAPPSADNEKRKRWFLPSSVCCRVITLLSPSLCAECTSNSTALLEVTLFSQAETKGAKAEEDQNSEGKEPMNPTTGSKGECRMEGVRS